MAGLTIEIAGGSEDRMDDGPDGRSPGTPEPGRDGGEVDIRAGHCTLPSAMPEAKPPEELPRFDEDQPRPVPSLQLQDGHAARLFLHNSQCHVLPPEIRGIFPP